MYTLKGLAVSRFLKKDTKSNRWDDVGDDIAREKASQVLRDAVSEKNGPMARSKKKIGPSHDVFRPIHIAVNQRPATDDRIQGEYSHYDRFQIPSFHPATVRDMPPSSTVLNHPYVYSAASYRPPSVSMTPRHPSVTPAIASDSRKRPRLQESPSTAYSYNRFSPHNTSVGMNTPTEMILSTPVARDQLMPSSRHGYFSHGSSQGAYSPASAMIPEHYASGSRNEPWMADIHLHDPTQRAPVAAASDFDPYNEDILSDHSDHRDGAISPIIYPKQEDSI